MVRSNRHEPGPGQEPLFGLDELDPSVSHEPTEGVSVSLVDRANHLGGTLRLLGESHKLVGYLKATGPPQDNPEGGEITARYGNALTRRMRKAATEKLPLLDRDARWQFAFASGWMALKGTGIAPDDELMKMARDDFLAFDSEHFGGPNQDRQRAKTRRILKRQAE